MKHFAFILVVILTCEALSDKEEWIRFKNNHKKIYKSYAEEIHRFTIFQSNLRRIENHNEQEKQGFSSYRMGVTKFADFTPFEFKNLMKLSKLQKLNYATLPINSLKYEGNLPSEVNWSKKGAVTQIKDQGACGSCWSFSATGTVESANFIKTGKLISLSEQNLVDCDNECYGCGGGLMTNALEYIKKNGIMAEKDYPYEAMNDKCRFNSTDVAVRISSFTKIIAGDELDLQKAVALVGPVSVAIDSTHNFQLYHSGIFDDNNCLNGKYALNHGVLAVGYGTQKGKDYWIVKNSWGTNWGMNGYIWMSRNKKNQCGISTDAVYAVV